MTRQRKAKRGTPRRKTSVSRRRDVKKPTVEVVAEGQAVDAGIGALTDTENVVGLGTHTLKLTEREEQILSEPVDPSKVLIHPRGMPYLPHTEYTRWFNRAFGRMGWSIVPAGKELGDRRNASRAYILYVKGKPVAFAIGEMGLANASAKHSDASEGTVGIALRRVAKRLGVGLELWDRAWLDEFLHAHGVRVKVQRRSETKTEWRRRDGARLPGEVGGGSTMPQDEPEEEAEGVSLHGRYSSYQDAPEYQERQRQIAEARQKPDNRSRTTAAIPATPASTSKELISDPQLRRFHTLVSNSGRDPQLVRDWLAVRFKYQSSRDIQRRHYDAICEAIQREGKLG